MHKQAKFDCFNQPVLVSATNVQHIGRMNSELDYFEKIQADKDRVDLLGPDSGDDGKPKGVFNVRSEVSGFAKRSVGLRYGFEKCSAFLC